MKIVVRAVARGPGVGKVLVGGVGRGGEGGACCGLFCNGACCAVKLVLLLIVSL